MSRHSQACRLQAPHSLAHQPRVADHRVLHFTGVPIRNHVGWREFQDRQRRKADGMRHAR